MMEQLEMSCEKQEIEHCLRVFPIFKQASSWTHIWWTSQQDAKMKRENAEYLDSRIGWCDFTMQNLGNLQQQLLKCVTSGPQVRKKSLLGARERCLCTSRMRQYSFAG
jgi:hypothetical protein